MSEMVERVKHAVEAALNCDEWRGDINTTRLASAAIEAMRDPTQAMLKAGDETMSNCWNLEAGKVWDSMCEAALTPTAA